MEQSLNKNLKNQLLPVDLTQLPRRWKEEREGIEEKLLIFLDESNFFLGKKERAIEKVTLFYFRWVEELDQY